MSKEIVKEAVKDTSRDAAREQALKSAMAQIEKSFGKGAIMNMDGNTSLQIEGIPTGALSLDIALGGKGVPRGRIIEVFGPEASGKTTLSLHIVAEAQKLGGVAAFVDAEHALDPSWAKRLGVNLRELLVSQPDTGEQGLEIVETLVRSNAVDVIVVDSVAALIPKSEIEGEMGDATMGVQARLMSQAMRKLTAAVSKSKSLVIFINQIRQKIGIVYGNPETTTGGNALKFYSSVRLDIRRVNAIKEAELTIGNHVRVKVVKNKIAPPFREAEFDILFDSGISYEGDLLDMGVNDNVIEKSGAWFNYGPVRMGQGREQARQFLKENPEVAKEVREKVLAHRFPKPTADDGKAKVEKAVDKTEKTDKAEKEKAKK